MPFTINQYQKEIRRLKSRVGHLEQTITRISSAAGLPDPAEACRTILKFCKVGIKKKTKYEY